MNPYESSEIDDNQPSSSTFEWVIVITCMIGLIACVGFLAIYFGLFLRWLIERLT